MRSGFVTFIFSYHFTKLRVKNFEVPLKNIEELSLSLIQFLSVTTRENITAAKK